MVTDFNVSVTHVCITRSIYQTFPFQNCSADETQCLAICTNTVMKSIAACLSCSIYAQGGGAALVEQGQSALDGKPRPTPPRRSPLTPTQSSKTTARKPATP